MTVINHGYGIYQIKNYVDKETCNKFVKIIDEEKVLNNFRAWSMQKTPNYVVDEPRPIMQKFIDKYVLKLSKTANELYNSNVDLVRGQTNFTYWPIDCGRIPHYDLTDIVNSLWYTSVLYLNDDYDKGEIGFPKIGLKIKPETGDLVIFEPILGTSEHEVTPTKLKPRYTLAVWLQSETLFTKDNYVI